MTSRRGFLGVLAAAMVADPERPLWVPGRKLISIPKPRIAMTPAIDTYACDLVNSAWHRLYVEGALKAIACEIDEHAMHGMPYPPAFHRDAFVLTWPRLGA